MPLKSGVVRLETGYGRDRGDMGSDGPLTSTLSNEVREVNHKVNPLITYQNSIKSKSKHRVNERKCESTQSTS